MLKKFNSESDVRVSSPAQLYKMTAKLTDFTYNGRQSHWVYILTRRAQPCLSETGFNVPYALSLLVLYVYDSIYSTPLSSFTIGVDDL